MLPKAAWKENAMCEIIVTVELNGKKYQTNVIANQGTSEETIQYLAEKQVIKQWLK